MTGQQLRDMAYNLRKAAELYGGITAEYINQKKAADKALRLKNVKLYGRTYTAETIDFEEVK